MASSRPGADHPGRCARLATPLACAVAVALWLLLAGAAHARGTLDQTTLPGNPMTSYGINEGVAQAQTFTAGRTGFLDTVELLLDSWTTSGHYGVDVVPTDGDGAPSGAPLASSTIEGCRILSPDGPVEVPFGPAAEVTAGTRYAIVVAYKPGTGSRHPMVTWGVGSPYASGSGFYAVPPGPNPTWTLAGLDDRAFATYVSETAPATRPRDETVTTVTSSLDPAPPGLVTFTATVTDPENPARVPTGVVAFRINDNGDTVTRPLDGEGRASQAIELRGGATISAEYCPDTDGFVGSTGTTTQTIVEDATRMSVVATPDSIRRGESTTLTATVTDTDDPARTPTGTVQFRIYGDLLGPPVALSSGVATLQTSSLEAATHVIDAVYTPDTGYFKWSSQYTVVTVGRWDSATDLVVYPAETVAGEPAIYDARVTGSSSDGHSPTGYVQFRDEHGSRLSEDVRIDEDGYATAVVFGHAGSRRVHAEYVGDSYFAGSDDSAGQTVLRADTATTIASAPNPVTAGGELTVVVDVAVLPPGDVDLDGSVQLLADGQPIDDPIFLGGYTGVEVTLRAPTTPGTGTITASYLGGLDTKPSSASLTQTIVPSAPTAQPPPPPPPPAVIAPTAADALATMISGLRKKLRTGGVRALNGLTETFRAPAAGRLSQRFYSPVAPRTALRAAGTRSTLIATAAATFSTARTAKVKVKLTPAGRRLVRRARTIALAVVTRFTPAVGSPTRRSDQIRVRRVGRPTRRATVRRTSFGWSFTSRTRHGFAR